MIFLEGSQTCSSVAEFSLLKKLSFQLPFLPLAWLWAFSKLQCGESSLSSARIHQHPFLIAQGRNVVPEERKQETAFSPKSLEAVGYLEDFPEALFSMEAIGNFANYSLYLRPSPYVCP